MELQCYEGHADAAACAAGARKSSQPAKVVHYRNQALRCDDADPTTWQNVAIVVDSSGSVSGQVSSDHKKCADSERVVEELPGQVVQTIFADCASDPFNILIAGGQQLIEA